MALIVVTNDEGDIVLSLQCPDAQAADPAEAAAIAAEVVGALERAVGW